MTFSLSFLDEFHSEYSDIRCKGLRNNALASKFKKDIYYTLRGGKMFVALPHRIPANIEPIDAYVGGDASTIKNPSTGMLCQISHAAAWFEQRDDARAIDTDFPSGYTPNREAKRHTSISQYGTEGWIVAPPDSSAPDNFSSAPYEVAVARRLGLPLHALVPFVADRINDGTLDYSACLGDEESNTAEHNTRHHATNRAVYEMRRSTAIHAVLLGDKNQEAKYKLVNEGRWIATTSAS